MPVAGRGLLPALAHNFLGSAPRWYKLAIAGALVGNPLLCAVAGPVVTAWALVAEFVLTLALALTCHPLPPAGLLAIEAVVLGLTSPQAVYAEVRANLATLLLIVFMVAGVYFLRDALLVAFTRLFVAARHKLALSLAFVTAAALLSAFLDALTVIAVISAVAVGLYEVDRLAVSQRAPGPPHDHTPDRPDARDTADTADTRDTADTADTRDTAHTADTPARRRASDVTSRVSADTPDTPARQEARDTPTTPARQDLAQFRAVLRNLVMHAAVGTTLGGLTTLVGEPQNLLIGGVAGWDFAEFFRRLAPVSLPVLVVGLLTTVLLETTGWFGYGAQLPATTRRVLEEWLRARSRQRDAAARARLVAQSLVGVFLVAALAFHVAEAGLIGLAVIVLATALTGVVDERAIGRAFQDALPFAGLLVVFFAIVAMIDQQGLVTPIIDAVLGWTGPAQAVTLFAAAGLLSMVSDNVFVASTYINQLAAAFHSGQITRPQLDSLAVVISAGTNIPSLATPNGQAALLFLLTSPLAGLIRLDYLTMLKLALPYALTLTATGLAAVALLA